MTAKSKYLFIEEYTEYFLGSVNTVLSPSDRFRVERGTDSLIGSAQLPGMPTKFAFQSPARLWFDKRPNFNYRITAIEIEEVK